MIKKRHNPKEIKYCQHNGHNNFTYEFNAGEVCYLVKKLVDGGHQITMVVCQDCYNNSREFELVEELKIATA